MKKEKIRTSEEIYKIIRDLFFENIVFRDYYDSCTFLKLICPLQRNTTSDFYRPWSLTKIMIHKEGLVCYIDTPGCGGWYALSPKARHRFKEEFKDRKFWSELEYYILESLRKDWGEIMNL